MIIQRKIRELLFLTAFLGCFGLVAASLQAQEKLEFTGTTMGPIRYNVTVISSKSVERDKLERTIAETLENVNQLMSTYIPDSDVSRFNQSESTDWLPVNAKTALVVHRAQEISQLSGGAFDITVGPAVEIWDFGAIDRGGKIPSEGQIQAVRKVVGFQKLSVQLDPPALKKATAGLRIDLSAIAKGFAVDEVAGELAKLGFENVFVEVGGEVFARGTKPGGLPWLTAIEKPLDEARELDKVVEVRNQGLATSGDYRNFRIVNGKRYSHTIDSTTCRPVEHGMASASVLAKDCMTADAWATAIMVLGLEKGTELVQQNGLAVRLVSRPENDADIFQTFVSETFTFADHPINDEQRATSGRRR